MTVAFDQFIGVFENVYDEKFCQSLIDGFNRADELGFALSRQQNNEGSRLKKDDTALFSQDARADRIFAKEYRAFLDKFWTGVYDIYANEYTALVDGNDRHHVLSVKIQKTEVGQGYHVWHCEHSSRETASRVLAFVLYLNDVDEGGETEFLYQHKRVKPKVGTVVVFPSSFTHVHRGNPPLSGTKYILTGWVEF